MAQANWGTTGGEVSACNDAVIFSEALPCWSELPAAMRSVCPRLGCRMYRLVVERLATGAAATPDPVRVMVCEPPEALSLTVTVPLSVPDTVGRKVTLMLQFPFGRDLNRRTYSSANNPCLP